MCHGRHACGVERFKQLNHLRQVRLGDGDAFRIRHHARLAHGRHQAAALFASALSRAAVSAAIHHARLVDAHVHHELRPHAAPNVGLDHVGDARAGVQLGDVGHHGGVGIGRRAEADFAGLVVCEFVVQEHGVHALANAEHRALPTETFGDFLLARDAVAQRRDARFGAHDGFHGVERLRKAGGFNRENHQVGRVGLARRHAAQIAWLAVDFQLIGRVALIARVVHHEFHGVVAERAGDHAAIQQPHATLADECDFVDAHWMHPFFEPAGG